ncbi:unnamed protein product [Brassica oleracea]
MARFGSWLGRIRVLVPPTEGTVQAIRWNLRVEGLWD